MLQLAVRWTGQSQLDQTPPKWTELAGAKTSSWSVKVRKGGADLRFAVSSRHRELLVRETPFLSMVGACGIEEFLKMDDFNIFLSSNLALFLSGFKVAPSLQQLRQVQQCNLGNSKENLG